ncbi:S8 family serine peptidase [Kitasatospora sp. NPDC057904]|uniref:S53 family peptidase n=1 Tax=Kitasatospora sp. NPDC057904 TaxID=3346275 RepID=UPI0036D8587D
MRPTPLMRFLLAVPLALALAATAAPAQALTPAGGVQPADPPAVTAERACAPASPAAADAPTTALTTPDGTVAEVPSDLRGPCLALIRTDLPPLQRLQPDTEPPGLGARDLQAAYNLPRNGGGERTVAIVVAFDDRTAESDLAVYREQYHLPPCTTANGCFRKINQNGGSTPPPTTDPGWVVEAATDLASVSATCPDCHILLVEADDELLRNEIHAVGQAFQQNATFISMSFGAPEFPNQTIIDSFFNHRGIAFVASSGDNGYPNPTWPAASQYVTAAGGTSLHRVRPPFPPFNRPGWSESAWVGAGSGCSLFEPKPAWQHDPGCANRTIADVSAVADPGTGVAVYFTDPTDGAGWHVIGGTSVAAPLIAGMYAVAGTPGANDFAASYPYAHPRAFNDITTGSNGSCGGSYLCTALPGYDGPTGLGTPHGVRGLRR